MPRVRFLLLRYTLPAPVGRRDGIVNEELSMTRRAKIRILTLILAIFSLSAVAAACGSWQPTQGEGKCAEGRKWVPAAQDPETGEMKEGYCEWLPGEQ